MPLYADLVADVTNGEVQVCVQEQYFAGGGVQPARFASQCSLLRGCRTLSADRRLDFVVMLKIGTHDDSFASHYVLVDPDQPGSPDDDDFANLDPDQPYRSPTPPWRLSDSYARLARNEDIARKWRDCDIRSKQLCAIWAFAPWRQLGETCLAADLLEAIAVGRLGMVLHPKSRFPEDGHLPLERAARILKHLDHTRLNRSDHDRSQGCGANPPRDPHVQGPEQNAEQEVTAVYDRHSHDAEKRKALNGWGRQLQHILSGSKSEKVVPFQQNTA